MKIQKSSLMPTLKGLALAVLAVAAAQLANGQTVTNYSTAGNNTWTCPVGVTNVVVECWGGGGGGGGVPNTARAFAGGGGGGAYATNVLAVMAGTTYNLTVGAKGTAGANTGTTPGGTGGTSYFGNSTAGTTNGAVVLAVGGTGGNGTNAAGGASGGPGGLAAACLPAATAISGISGTIGTNSGVNATSYGGGGGAGANGGAGAANNSNGIGGAGTAPGGGGSGAANGASAGARLGGLGGLGMVRLTYTIPNYTVTYDKNAVDATGSQTDPSSPYVAGATVTVTNQGTILRTGYAFNGWNTAADGSGTAYVAGNTFTISANTTLYGQWQASAATISASTSGPLSALSTTYGTASAANSFTVSGTGITDGNGITVTAPAGFEVSLTAGSGYASTVYVSGSGTIPSTTIYARLAATTGYGTYSGNVVCASAGATSKNVSIASSSVARFNLTLTGATALNKAQDGTVNATISGGTLSPTPPNGDVITATNGQFAQSTPGTGIAVTVLLGGPGTNNYSLTQPGLTANIYASAIWANAAGGLWGTAANWQNSFIGGGYNTVCDFSQLNLTSDTTVSLDSAYLVGSLLFGDTDTNSAANWVLDNGANPANTLTLAGANPTINVSSLGSANTVTISAGVAGTSGLIKAGNGTLVLSGTNTYTGNTVVGAGTLVIGTTGSLVNGSSLSNNGVFVNYSSVSQTISNLSGAGPCTQLGAGSLTLAGNNTNYSGVLTVTTGKVLATTGSCMGTNTVVLNGGELVGDNGTAVTYGNNISVTANSTITADKTGGPAGVTYTLGNLSIGTQTLTVQAGAGVGNGAPTIKFGAVNLTGAPTFLVNANGSINTTLSMGALSNGSNSVTFDGTGKSLVTGNLSGNGGVVMNGSGSVALSGANTYTGNTTINAGSISLTGNGQLGTGNYAGNITNNSSLAVNSSLAQWLSGIISGSGTLSVSNSSVLSLSGLDTYSGNTTVNAGQLAGVTGGSASNSVVYVAGTNATVGVNVANNSATWACAGLTYSAAGKLDFNFSSNTPSPTLAPLQVLGTADFNVAVPTVTLEGSSFSPGTYPLMTWGALNGSAPSVITTPSPVYNASLSVTGNTLYVTIATSPRQPLKWATGSGTWDIGVTAAWKDGLGSVTVYSNLPAGDLVEFEDTLSGTSPITVDLTNTVSPSGIVFSNTSKAYTVSSSLGGKISGSTSLIKFGTNSVTLTTTNDYAGGTVINAGTLSIAGAGSLANASAVSNNGVFIYNSTASQAIGSLSGTGACSQQGPGPLTLSGNNTNYSGVLTVAAGKLQATTANSLGANTVMLNGGELVGYNTTTTTYGNSIAVTANSTITADKSSGPTGVTYSFGALSIGGQTLTVQGGSYATIGGSQGVVFTGDVTVSGSSKFIVNSNAVSGLNTQLHLNSTNSTALNMGSNSLTFDGSGSTTVVGPVSGSGNLTKSGAGTLTLSGTNTYTGNTTVNGGTLALGVASLAANSTVTVTNGASVQLEFSGTNQIAALVLNGVSQSAGVYNNANVPAFITGVGSLRVGSPSAAASTNALLTSLTLNPVVSFSPTFVSNILSGYTATVPYGSLTVTVTNADVTAINVLSLNGSGLGNLISGTPRGGLSLTLGTTNALQVLVTAQDGVTTNRYLVNVLEQPSLTVPRLTNSYDGTSLTLSWAADHLGYRLMKQTNNLNQGVSSNTNDWATVAGSTSVTATNLPVVKTNLGGYYRLVYP